MRGTLLVAIIVSFRACQCVTLEYAEREVIQSNAGEAVEYLPNLVEEEEAEPQEASGSIAAELMHDVCMGICSPVLHGSVAIQARLECADELMRRDHRVMGPACIEAVKKATVDSCFGICATSIATSKQRVLTGVEDLAEVHCGHLNTPRKRLLWVACHKGYRAGWEFTRDYVTEAIPHVEQHDKLLASAEVESEKWAAHHQERVLAFSQRPNPAVERVERRKAEAAEKKANGQLPTICASCYQGAK